MYTTTDFKTKKALKEARLADPGISGIAGQLDLLHYMTTKYNP